MIQRFIELGEGYADIYELLDLIRYNKNRASRLAVLHTVINDRKVVSPALIMKKTEMGNFQAIYISREGIPDLEDTSERLKLIESAAAESGVPIVHLDVQPSTVFGETELYFQHLIGILRMNRYIAPLS
ncbi:hypothetical protein KP77_17310 [Jeotgalibacillus alimentarius]|uniref:DUF7147 domain-containing protein n=1 Tax=Jeotgalibacillus alimentarius TaxID=135826 RepID=A0A0C2W156_9BACL|nr:hypothetical protein [Jeotgalibacillus alimentarius]KIL50356.1 hypothetical protein KP77_17310 [Jeotgalibacillus alimentarius]